MTDDMTPKELYLGDGVYAIWNGYSVSLDCRCQENSRPCPYIVLDPAVIQSLEIFLECVKKECQRNREAQQIVDAAAKCEDLPPIINP